MSIKKGGLPKGKTNEKKRGTKTSIDNSKNEITAILYNNKT